MNKKTIFLQSNEMILKLETSVDNNILSSLKDEIISNCSKIKSIKNEKRSDYYLTRYKEDDHYRNVLIGVIRNEYQNVRYSYDHCHLASYDYYDYPDIVDQISEILSGKFGNELGFNVSFDNSTFKDGDSVEDYHEKIFNCFTFEKVSSMSISQLQEFSTFVNDQENDFQLPTIAIDDLDDKLQNFVLKKIEYSKSADSNTNELVVKQKALKNVPKSR